jgi:hypothetical protein
MYDTDRKVAFVHKKLLGDLSAIETYSELWNIKINGDETQAICYSHRLGSP